MILSDDNEYFDQDVHKCPTRSLFQFLRREGDFVSFNLREVLEKVLSDLSRHSLIVGVEPRMLLLPGFDLVRSLEN